MPAGLKVTLCFGSGLVGVNVKLATGGMSVARIKVRTVAWDSVPLWPVTVTL